MRYRINYRTRLLSRITHGILLINLIGTPFAHASIDADNGGNSFVGKEEWLFLRGEFPGDNDEATTGTSMNLIRRFNKVLANNGITLAFTMVPLKARIYEKYLPDDAKMSAYMNENSDRKVNTLRAGQVNVIDLNGPFLNSPLRNSAPPLFFRLDTHWTPAGAMLAAESIRAGIDTNPVLKKAMEAAPEVKFNMTWAKHKINSTIRAQIEGLPKGSPTFAAEQVLPFSVVKEQAGGNLLGEGVDPVITLLGTSYSGPFYGFSDALRYTLQRDVLTVWVSNTQGSWVGMESYLRDDSFQTKRPKLLIWEMPERSMDTPPDYKYRDARFQSDNTEWLLRASAWIQGSCTPSQITAKIIGGGLVTGETDSVSAGKTTDRDFIELRFNKPVEKLDYLVANAATNGSKKLVLEASGDGVETRWIDVPVPGNGAEHVFKAPLPSDGKGYTKLRIYPGKSSAFTFKGLQVCRQPEDLLL